MMWEDIYQVYRRYGDGEYDLRASDMTIDDAVLFVKTVFAESFNEDTLRFEIRRQPMTYGKAGRGEDGEVVVHYNLKENAELIAKILDADVNGEVWRGEEDGNESERV